MHKVRQENQNIWIGTYESYKSGHRNYEQYLKKMYFNIVQIMLYINFNLGAIIDIAISSTEFNFFL